jgi:glycosyltransferase involved in cell wall biosynthesis
VHLFVDVEPQRVAALLAGARACVQTSLTESFPLAVLEAGACGTPLVVSAIPGHDELVHDGIDGRTFALGDPADCAAAIESVLNNPAEAARMACVQKQRIRSTLTWSAAMSQYLRLAGEAA